MTVKDENKMTREEVIQALLTRDLDNCEEGGKFDDAVGYVCHLLRVGCRGYNNWTDAELKKEYEELLGEEIKIVAEHPPALRLAAFGCYVKVHDGTLLCAPMLEGGGIDMDGNEPNWGEVTDPDSQGFLDAVNATFGTSYTMEHFAGR